MAHWHSIIVNLLSHMATALSGNGSYKTRHQSRSTVIDVYLFRAVEQTRLHEFWPQAMAEKGSLERRRVPMPRQESVPGIVPGTRCWRVEQDHGHFQAEDLILAGDHSSPPALCALAKVWRFGNWQEIKIEAGINFVITRAPFLVSPLAKIGTTPLIEHLIEAGEYVVVLRKAGFEDLRLSFHVDYLEDPYHHHGHADMSLSLWKKGTTEAGFVRVSAEVYEEDNCSPFAMMRHEVTNKQYLEFINDKVTRQKITESQARLFLPRDRKGKSVWPGNAQDGFRLPKESGANLPVTQISQVGALSFADWRNRNSKRGGVYSIPNRAEWKRGTYGGDFRIYTSGSYFRQDWIHSRYAAPKIELAPVMSYERDESIFGAFDMSGGVSEWSELFKKSSWALGGSYLDSVGAAFRNSSAREVPMDDANIWVGFRLVWRKGENK